MSKNSTIKWKNVLIFGLLGVLFPPLLIVYAFVIAWMLLVLILD